MIYFYLKQLDEPGFEGRIPVYVCNEKGLLTENFLKNSMLFDSISDVAPNPRIAWLPEYKVPIVIFDSDVPDPHSLYNITQFMDYVHQVYNKLGGNIPDDIKAKIQKIFAKNVGEKKAELFITICIQQIQYENRDTLSYPINISANYLDSGDFSVITSKNIREHNKLFKTVFQSISDLENTTLYQNTCTDDLFIEIPDRNTLLMSENIKWSQIIPRRAEVCHPYSDKNAYSPEYKEKNVPDYLIPLIEGQKENDYLPIQDNEKKYYNALMEWISYNVKEEFGSDSDIIDGLSKEYLTELAQRVYSWHWGHNPNIPVSFLDDDDSEREESTSGDISSRYEFASMGDISKYDNAVVSLEIYLENASAELGYKVYPEAIVKLARWGTRKGTVLSLENYPLVFDLTTDKVRRNLGSISDYKLKLIDGKQYKFVCWITPSVNAIDNKFSNVEYKKIPIGMALKNFLENDNGEEIDVPVYYSLFDAVDMIDSGSITIAGIESANDRSISISDLVKDYTVNSNDFLQNPFWRSQDLKNLCIEFGTTQGDTELNLMSILDSALKNSNLLNDLIDFMVTSIDDLREKVKSFKIFSIPAALSVNLARIIFPVVDKAGDLIKSGQSVLDAWREALKLWHGVRSILTEPTVQLVSSNSKLLTQSTVQFNSQPMQSFSQSTQSSDRQILSTSQSMQHTDQLAQQINFGDNSLILEINPKAMVTYIVTPAKKILGGYVKEPLQLSDNSKIMRYILLDKNTLLSIPDERKTGKSVNILKIFSYFVRDVENAANGTLYKSELCFCSKQALLYYRKAIAELCASIIDTCNVLMNETLWLERGLKDINGVKSFIQQKL